MFYCDKCRIKNKWPLSAFASRGMCEVCGSHAMCNDVPSNRLPVVATRLTDAERAAVVAKSEAERRANPHPFFPASGRQDDGRLHALADSPLHGKASKWGMATVTRGDFVGRDVCIMVEYLDGWCICDMGDDDPMEIIHIRDLMLSKRVNSISISTDWKVTTT